MEIKDFPTLGVNALGRLEKLDSIVTESVIKAEGRSIETAEDYLAATEIRKGLVALVKEIEAVFDPIVETARRSLDKARETKRIFSDKPKKAIEAIDQKIGVYLRALREKKAEDERKQREAEDQRRKAEASLKKAETLEANGKSDQADRELEKAAKAEEKATKIEQSAAPAPKPVAAKGTYIVETWDFEIQDAAALPREFLKPDEVAIRKALQEKKNLGFQPFQVRIPGLNIFLKSDIRQRL